MVHVRTDVLLATISGVAIAAHVARTARGRAGTGCAGGCPVGIGASVTAGAAIRCRSEGRFAAIGGIAVAIAVAGIAGTQLAR